LLEYVFFQEEPRQQFLAFLAAQGVPWGLEARDPEIVVVIDDTTLAEDLLERLELLYDDLFDLDQQIFEKKRGRLGGRRSLTLSLRHGRALAVELPADLVDRVLTVLTPQELNNLADGIAQAVEAELSSGRRTG